MARAVDGQYEEVERAEPSADVLAADRCDVHRVDPTAVVIGCRCNDALLRQGYGTESLDALLRPPVPAVDSGMTDPVRPGLRTNLAARHGSDTLCLPVGELRAFLTEYDRRGAVEQAAARYIMAGLCGNLTTHEELAALIAAVRTNRSFRG